MKKWSAVFLAVALVLVLAAAMVLYNGLKDRAAPEALGTVAGSTQPAESGSGETVTGETEEQANPAPEFTVYDGENTAVTLADKRGKPVILNFWATWCGYCVEEMPEFQAAFEEYGDRIHFMMVNATDNSRETVEKAAAFIADSGYTFPVYYDIDSSAVMAYSVNAMPVTFFIDGEGNFVVWAQGALTRDILQRGIDILLEED